MQQQLNNEMKEELEVLKQRLNNAKINTDQHTNIFMSASNLLKEAYV